VERKKTVIHNKKGEKKRRVLIIVFRNNHVTLDILKSLIQSCHRDLNLFSKYVAKVIELILETNDTELVDHACQVVNE
jgi:hypothetical protein